MPPLPDAPAPFADAYRGKSVFVTGHTGFKGAWLCEWLLGLGARVTGYSLNPPTAPSLFEQLGLPARLGALDLRADIRDAAALARAVADADPDYVFHLAAQPLVRLSYRVPVETYATNVMGTAHVLEALRPLKKPCAAVFITTDKCYENQERDYAYVEEDPLGGADPYSSSKAAAELVVSAYRRSFFTKEERPVVGIASARAGNVIGGGDWAEDRIVPDSMRALGAGLPIGVRNPRSTRPWQHVLEPLGGYLWLGRLLHASLIGAEKPAADLCAAFNFGPDSGSNRDVESLVGEVLRSWPGKWDDRSAPGQVHEAHLLNLSIAKAERVLGWKPVWPFAETIRETVSWYREAAAGGDPGALTRNQIAAYAAAARQAGQPWA